MLFVANFLHINVVYKQLSEKCQAVLSYFFDNKGLSPKYNNISNEHFYELVLKTSTLNKKNHAWPYLDSRSDYKFAKN